MDYRLKMDETKLALFLKELHHFPRPIKEREGVYDVELPEADYGPDYDNRLIDCCEDNGVPCEGII